MKFRSVHYPQLVAFAITLAASSLTQADVAFNFTEAEGFTTAGLNGQNSWTATAGIQANVDPTKEWLFIAGGSGQNAQYTGETYNSQDGVLSFTQEFRFNYTGDIIGDLYNIFKLDSDSAGDISRIFIHFNGTTFRLRYSTGNGFDRDLRSSANLPQSDFGMNIGTDNNSDLLRLTWDLTRGTTASDWSFIATLENVDANTTILTWNVEGVTVTDNFQTDTSLVVGFSATNRLGSTNVHSFSASTVSDSFWAGATPAGDDYYSLEWLGFFYTISTESVGDMYHVQHGWLYYTGGDIDDFWVYDSSISVWMFFGSVYYPWIYIYGESEISGWNYFYGGSPDSRFFYNANTDTNWTP